MKKILVALFGLFMSSAAFADLAHGTPQFTCTKPTQGVDNLGGLYTLPATGVDALKEIRWYIDAGVDANGFIVAGATVRHTDAGTAACDWQTVAGDIPAGAHVARATAVDNSDRVSKASNPLAFTVPAAVRTGPNAPGSLQVQ